MADTFPVSGNIDPTTFPHLLVNLHHQGATGSLKVTGTVHPKALYFRGGRILFGSSNDPRDQLGAILIEGGKITREQLDEVNAKVGPGNPLAKVLKESGFVNQRELSDAARVKVERILSDVLSWESGSFEFEDGVLPKGAVDLKLPTGRLLLASIQRIEDRSFALRHLGGDMSIVLEPTPEEEASPLEEVRGDVWPLLERLDGKRTLQDAVALTRMDEFEAAKTACAMLFLGITRKREPAGSQEVDLAEEARNGLADSGMDLQVGDAADSSSGVPDFPALDAEPMSPGLVDDDAARTVAFLSDQAGGLPVPEGHEDAEPVPESTGFAFVEPEAESPPDPEEFAEAGPEPPPVVLPEPDEPLAPTFVDAEVEPLFAAEAQSPTPAEAEVPGASAPPQSAAEEATPAFAEAEPPAPPPIPLELQPEPAPLAPPEPAPPTASDFAVPPPARSESDTVPGDRPVYVPPGPSEAPPTTATPPPRPDSTPPEPPSTRPSKEDLAALDALLNPQASGGSGTALERPRAEKWEPQFRTGSTTPPRRAVGRKSQGSRAPLIGGIVVAVVAVLAGGYFWLSRSPSPAPPPPPPTTPTPTLSAPATVDAAPTQGATAAVPEGGAAEPAAERATPAATPPPAPATPAPATSQRPTASATSPQTLLRQGSLDEAARGFAAALGANPAGQQGIQALVACSPETVHKAVQNVPDDQLFILPVNYKGRDCYRICWGVYPDRAAAEAAARQFPGYFRENSISPRIQPLVELLP